MSAFLALEEGYLEKLNHVERKKHLQKIKIVRHLYVKGARSNAEICNRFSISSPTSMALLNELLAEGLVEKQGRGESVGGRKPELYGLRNNSLFVLSIEMEKFSTRMAIFDGNNHNITGSHTFPIRLSKNLTAVDELHHHANSLILSSGIDTDKLMGIGLSLPGLVSSKEGASYTYLLTGQNEMPLQDLLALKFNKPVYIQNDVKSATLAEYRFGAAQGKRDVLVLTLDWGIGLGVITDGKLRIGTSGFAGEFGHIPFIDDGVLCHCGKRGCLETVASGSALARMAREGMQAGQETLLKELSGQELEKIEPQAIIQAANEGDQFAINMLAETGRNLGKGIAMLIQLFNPELIIIGGKIAEARQYITTPIQQSINTYCMTQLRERTEVALSQLGQEAGILGPVATVMERIFEHRIESTK
ncbi:ROK family protein [Pontibacter sp. JH31]|uniref:ROK family protein n=1 Tax=Pontibacter aquaedesilientis TaxID=2766980 RepID=A0ABR7XEE5_9BACT|nr:ROK family transcriptional regulator [Pontibacter aquaedesilientis]MBD1396659.1 ROK family protein [Pontibacter aquaedesilientis]